MTDLALHRIDAPEELDLTHLVAVLDAGERDRLRRFRRETDRRRYLAAHVGLRLVLGDRLGLAPRAVRLGRAACPLCGAEHGRPISLDDPHATQFSIAHTDGLVLVAVADATVGVDVEPTGGPDLRDDLDGTLHPDDRRAIDSLPRAERPTALLSRWVRAEAHLKALGTGLGLDPSTVAVGPARASGATTDLGGWSVVDLDVGPSHVAALAVAGVGPEVVAPLAVKPLTLPRG